MRSSLEARGIVRQPVRAATWVSRGSLVAAGILIGFIAGFVSRAPAARSPVVVPSIGFGGQYVLLLYGDPVDDTGAVHHAREREYGAWASSLRDSVYRTGGHELGAVVAELSPTGSTPLRNDRLTGYFVLTARSREQATATARSVPHLTHGGRAVLMEVEP